MSELRLLLSYICGQEHCWELGGVVLPFCQRCTGLYVGACCAMALVSIFRPRPSAWLYWLHGSFMLVMVPFGFHFVEHGGLARTFTGALFGYGLVYYLALNPFTFWRRWKPDSSVGMAGYFLLIAGCTGLLLWSVRSGGDVAALILTVLGVLGVGCLVLLSTVNALVLPATLRQIRAHSAGLTR